MRFLQLCRELRTLRRRTQSHREKSNDRRHIITVVTRRSFLCLPADRMNRLSPTNPGSDEILGGSLGTPRHGMNFRRYTTGVVILWLSMSLISRAQFATGAGGIAEAIQKADALQEKGAIEDARKLYESLLVSLRPQPPTAQLAHVLNAMGHVMAAEGNYDSAIKFAQQSAEVYHRVGDKTGEAHALNNEGIAEIQRGLYPAAELSLGKALALARSASDQENEVQILNNLGSANLYRGKYLEAMRRYQEAMSGVDKAAEAKWTSYWRQITAVNQATLLQRLGRYESALQIYRRVIASSSTLTDNDRAHLLTNLGALYRRLGDPWKALESYGAALKLYSKGKDADGELSTLKNIGIVHALDQNDLDKAAQIFRRALALATTTHNGWEEMQAHLYLGETYLRKSDATSARQEFQEALQKVQKLGSTEQEWKVRYGLGQAEEMSGDLKKAESEYRQAISAIEKTRAELQLSALRAEFLVDKRDAYDALIKLLVDRNDVLGAFSILERSRARTFQDRLRAASGERAAQPGLTLADVQKLLDPSTMLIEFWAAADRVALIWCTRDASGMSQERFSPADLDRLRQFANALPEDLSGNGDDAMALLQNLLPEDLLSRSSGLQHIRVVPDGWLGLLPLELIQVPDGSKERLIERVDVSYLPTAALLRRSQLAGDRMHFPWTRELVAFGDPSLPTDESAHADPPLPKSNHGELLPYSRDETHSVASMAAGKVEIFLGADDRKDLFLGGKANSAFLLHVSTHAVADTQNPENSRLLFSPSGNGTADYVFLRELYGMDLSTVRLATISACDTERGKVIRGEGVQAFSRALLAAGSRSSLTTLWRVDDYATAEFMKQFYFFALKKNLPTAQALRLAKLKFLRSGTPLANPQYWAAFVINGDGVRPLPRVISWTTIALLSAGVLVIVLLLAYWLRIRRRSYGQHYSRTVVSQ